MSKDKEISINDELNEILEDSEIKEVISNDDEEIENEKEIVDDGGNKAESEQSEIGETETTETIVTFGDDPATKDDNPKPENLVNKLRKENRKKNERIAELEKLVKTDENTGPGEKPTLAGYNYHEENFSEALIKWNAEVQESEAKAGTKRQQVEQAEKEWTDRVEEYNSGKSDFDAEDFEAAEDIVKLSLDETQGGIIVQAFGSKAAAFVSGLANDPSRLGKLALVKNPIMFAIEIAKLESSMKVTSNKPKTTPERRIAGNAGNSDGSISQLRADAEKTGDYTKYYAAKRARKKT